MLPAKERDRTRQCEYPDCDYRNRHQYYLLAIHLPFSLYAPPGTRENKRKKP
jgi:hypothetical protein